MQEKLIYVEHACELHGDNGSAGGYRGISGDQDIVDVAADSTDGLDDGDSVFSTAITLSRATSFVAVGEQDIIEEMLQMLVNDPLLSWDKLLRHQNGEDVKDVKFFLRAFESDLREAANSTMEHHACAFLRSRIRYLSSQICERFNLKESAAPDLIIIDDEKAAKSTQQLQPITLEDPDPTLMPPFSMIRSFMFAGVAFRSLKENVKNFTQNTRDYLEEVTDVISKNIHPPDLALAKSSLVEENTRPLREILEAFLSALEKEAILCNLSASNRVGIKSLQSDTWQLTARVGAFWTSGVPLWHFYPPVPVPGKGSCGQSDVLSKDDGGRRSEYEMFEAFICSSSAFLDLAQSVARLSRKSEWKSRLPQSIALFCSQGTSATPPSHLGKTAISFDCVSSIAPTQVSQAECLVVLWTNDNRQLHRAFSRRLAQQGKTAPIALGAAAIPTGSIAER